MKKTYFFNDFRKQILNLTFVFLIQLEKTWPLWNKRSDRTAWDSVKSREGLAEEGAGFKGSCVSFRKQLTKAENSIAEFKSSEDKINRRINQQETNFFHPKEKEKKKIRWRRKSMVWSRKEQKVLKKDGKNDKEENTKHLWRRNFHRLMKSWRNKVTQYQAK